LLNTRFVKSFVIGNKNDFNDAAAIFDGLLFAPLFILGAL
jgi:hypothetical protein